MRLAYALAVLLCCMPAAGGSNLRKINRNNRRKRVRSICRGNSLGDCRTICASYNDVTACRRDCNDCWDDIDGNIRTGGLFDDCDGDGDCLDGEKLNAAQKRQNKRDQRRFYDDPYRTQDQEIREQMRKQEQAFRRSHPPTDPNDTRFGDSWYVEKREARRYVRCNRTGDGCDYITDPETYERLYRAERLADRILQDRNARRNYRNVLDEVLEYGYDEDDCLDTCDESFALLSFWTIDDHEACEDACFDYWEGTAYVQDRLYDRSGKRNYYRTVWDRSVDAEDFGVSRRDCHAVCKSDFSAGDDRRTVCIADCDGYWLDTSTRTLDRCLGNSLAHCKTTCVDDYAGTAVDVCKTDCKTCWNDLDITTVRTGNNCRGTKKECKNRCNERAANRNWSNEDRNACRTDCNACNWN